MEYAVLNGNERPHSVLSVVQLVGKVAFCLLFKINTNWQQLLLLVLSFNP